MGWDKGTSISAIKIKKASAYIYITFSRPILWCPSSNSFFGKTPCSVISKCAITWSGVSLCGSALHLCPLSNPCSPPACLLQGQSEEWRSLSAVSLMDAVHCSARGKALLGEQCCFGHKYTAQHHVGCCEENYLPLSQTTVQGFTLFFGRKKIWKSDLIIIAVVSLGFF